MIQTLKTRLEYDPNTKKKTRLEYDPNTEKQGWNMIQTHLLQIQKNAIYQDKTQYVNFWGNPFIKLQNDT